MAGGHLINALDHYIYSTTVKSISVKLDQVIAHKVKLEILCGDIGNAYVNAYTNEKLYSIAGAEFCKAMKGSIVIIVRALYSLRRSSERWHNHLDDTLCSFNFKPTIYDNNVWIRHSEDGNSYDYVCIHGDNFMAVGKSAQQIMDEIKSLYTVKAEGRPDYYLGNDYKKDKKGRLCVGSKKYIKEVLTRIDSIFGTLRMYANPSETRDNPKLDNSNTRGDKEH